MNRILKTERTEELVPSLVASTCLAQDSAHAENLKNARVAVEWPLSSARTSIKRTVTNQYAANVPMSGDITLDARELNCQWPMPTPGVSGIDIRSSVGLCIVGEEFPNKDDARMVGSYIVMADAASGKQNWRTFLKSPNVSGRWIGHTKPKELAQ